MSKVQTICQLNSIMNSEISGVVQLSNNEKEIDKCDTLQIESLQINGRKSNGKKLSCTESDIED